MNRFLHGLDNEDWAGWKYDPECKCSRCNDFLEAAYWAVERIEFGHDVTPP
jgi:hypothetical protein